MSFLIKSTLFITACLIAYACGDKETHTDTDSLPVEDTVYTHSMPNQSDSETPSDLTLAFAGDIMMGTTYPEGSLYLPEDDGRNLFADVAEILKHADLAAANLEGTLFDGKGKVKQCADSTLCFAFRMPTRYASYLSEAGIDFLGIANNHINDFGPEAIRSTLSTLDSARIAAAGLRTYCPQTTLERNGVKIGLAAFGHSAGTPSIMNYDEVKSIVSGLKDTHDIVVVSFHGGGEGTSFQHVPFEMETAFDEKRGDVAKFARTAVDAGADIVFGHGPHVVRGMEIYRDRLIMYSLGNFCTPRRMGISGVSGYAPVVEATLNPDGTFKSGRIHSFIQKPGAGPRKDFDNRAALKIRSLSHQDFPSSPLLIADDGTLSIIP